jgi:hypothetical protein
VIRRSGSQVRRSGENFADGANAPSGPEALLGTGVTTKKTMLQFPTWVAQDRDVRLSDTELAELETVLHMKQLAMLPPERHTPSDLDFIVPRVLELT